MAEASKGSKASKTFWGKFKKSKLDQTFHSRLPAALLEMFPSKDDQELYRVYSNCNNDIAKTVEHFTKKQAANFYDEIPIEVLIESLSLEKSQNASQISGTATTMKKKNYFNVTPTHILSEIFTYCGPYTLGKITQINRECRLLSKSILGKITNYDFTFYYRAHCTFKNAKRSRSNLRLVNNDDIKLISHINAFPYLQSLSLRSTDFVKWYRFRSILNKNNIKYLNLASSTNLYDDDINIIIDQFPSLQILDLSKCIEITDLAMTYIIEHENINKLHTIHLNKTPQITKNGIKQLLNYKKIITSLEWKNCKFGNMSQCFESASHLKYLNLTNARNVQRFALQYEKYENHPFDLEMGNCKVLNFIDLRIQHLTSVNLTQCLRLRELRISNAMQLKEINCRTCTSLQLMAIPCKTVEIVQLSGCSSLNVELLLNKDNFLMQSIKSGCLWSLDMTNISNITDDDVDAILEANNESIYKPLKAFSVNECRQLSKSKILWINQYFQTPKTKSPRAEKRKQWKLDRKNRKYSM